MTIATVGDLVVKAKIYITFQILCVAVLAKLSMLKILIINNVIITNAHVQLAIFMTGVLHSENGDTSIYLCLVECGEKQ